MAEYGDTTTTTTSSPLKDKLDHVHDGGHDAKMDVEEEYSHIDADGDDDEDNDDDDDDDDHIYGGSLVMLGAHRRSPLRSHAKEQGGNHGHAEELPLFGTKERGKRLLSLEDHVIEKRDQKTISPTIGGLRSPNISPPRHRSPIVGLALRPSNSAADLSLSVSGTTAKKDAPDARDVHSSMEFGRSFASVQGKKSSHWMKRYPRGMHAIEETVIYDPFPLLTLFD
jgi:hypothetical protein